MPTVRSYLETTHVFSLKEFKATFGENKSSYMLLARAVKAGQADRPARGVYVSRMGPFKDTEPDPFLIAAALADDVVLAYHSALEAHGFAHSPWRHVQFVSSHNMKPFTYEGFSYKRYPPPRLQEEKNSARFTTLLSRGQSPVRVTTRERTLVDVLGRSDLGGGLEEVLRSLASMPFVDTWGALEYLQERSKRTLVARTGWVLEQRMQEWYVDPDALLQMKDMLGKGPYFFTSTNERGVWVPGWRLYLPGDAQRLSEWLSS